MIYDSINQLEPIEQDGQFYQPVTELYVWPASIAAGLWLLLIALRLASNRYQAKPDMEADHG